MAATDNIIQITGTLGKDPELKYIQSGRAVCSFSVATNRKWKDRADQWQEETCWHKYVTEIIADSVAAELRFATVIVERIERDKSTSGGTNPPARSFPEEEPF